MCVCVCVELYLGEINKKMKFSNETPFILVSLYSWIILFLEIFLYKFGDRIEFVGKNVCSFSFVNRSPD